MLRNSLRQGSHTERHEHVDRGNLGLTVRLHILLERLAGESEHNIIDSSVEVFSDLLEFRDFKFLADRIIFLGVQFDCRLDTVFVS